MSFVNFLIDWRSEMKSKIIFCILLINLLPFLVCEDKNNEIDDSYTSEAVYTVSLNEEGYVRIDNGFTHSFGQTLDGEYLLIHWIYFSYDLKVEGYGVSEGWDNLTADIVNQYLAIHLTEFVSKKIIQMNTFDYIIEIVKSEKYDLFTEGIEDFLKNDKNINEIGSVKNVIVTKVQFNPR
jgi:hypothetical protein